VADPGQLACLLDQRWSSASPGERNRAGTRSQPLRQPDTQRAFGPRRGRQPAPRSAAKATRLDGPGEGQTLE